MLARQIGRLKFSHDASPRGRRERARPERSASAVVAAQAVAAARDPAEGARTGFAIATGAERR